MADGGGGDTKRARTTKKVSLLDYGAGNVRSVRNAIKRLGYVVEDISTADHISSAEVLIFPGVGSFGNAMETLTSRGLIPALKAYVQAGRPFFGICLGMQTLFEGSEESPGVTGLGIIPGVVRHFRTMLSSKSAAEDGSDRIDVSTLTVPHIGWNELSYGGERSSSILEALERSASAEKTRPRVYFVHSFRVVPEPACADWVLTTTTYAGVEFVSSVQKGNVTACQFHPEKSGGVGLAVLGSFLAEHLEKRAPTLKFYGLCAPQLGERGGVNNSSSSSSSSSSTKSNERNTGGLAKRVLACLDVRSNDDGDLVVTKGDQYDVREEAASEGSGGCDGGSESSSVIGADVQREGGNTGKVRNLGKPVALAQRYFEEGADEVVFLNITSFRDSVLEDTPMLAVLEQASETIFVPLTVGGGIRGYTDSTGKSWTAVEVASRYFRAGADKVSLGTDAVYAAEKLALQGEAPDGSSAIEQISTVYGRQAVVISVDPRRVYVDPPPPSSSSASSEAASFVDDKGHTVVTAPAPCPTTGRTHCWYQATVKGGREGRDIDAVQLAKACERLGAGEIMLNCIDADGQGSGYEHPLIAAVLAAVSVPVIASSGAGAASHFPDVFAATDVQAALAAGMFHRHEVAIADVKKAMQQRGFATRIV